MGSWVCPNCLGRKRGYDAELCRGCYRDPLVRFWRKVELRGPDECWPWRAGVDKDGYGVFGLTQGENARAHRYAYELVVGPIPADQVLDHLCRVPSCCNPSHLEPVTSRENILRGTGGAARNAKKTHCPKGHAYAGDNLEIRANGARRCRECRREADRRRWRRRAITQQRSAQSGS